MPKASSCLKVKKTKQKKNLAAPAPTPATLPPPGKKKCKIYFYHSSNFVHATTGHGMVADGLVGLGSGVISFLLLG